MNTYKTVHGAFVHTTAPLKYCPKGQCGVDIENGSISLVSYSTRVMTIQCPNIIRSSCRVLVNGLYSATTRRHISYFLAEYLPSLPYRCVKYAYEHNCYIYFEEKYGSIIYVSNQDDTIYKEEILR